MREIPAGFLVPLQDVPHLALPLDAVKISAGFPSPAADYEDMLLERFQFVSSSHTDSGWNQVGKDNRFGANYRPQYSL